MQRAHKQHRAQLPQSLPIAISKQAYAAVAAVEVMEQPPPMAVATAQPAVAVAAQPQGYAQPVAQPGYGAQLEHMINAGAGPPSPEPDGLAG